VIWQILVGIGNGLVLAALAGYVVTRAPADAVAINSGLLNTARTVGGAVSSAAFATVMAAMVTRLPGAVKPVTTEAGYVTVWLVCAGLTIGIAFLALRFASPTPLPAASAGRPEALARGQLSGQPYHRTR
jgi:hypothetical protein